MVTGNVREDPGKVRSSGARGRALQDGDQRRQRTEDVDIKRYAQRLLKESGSLAYSRDKCRELKFSIIADVERVGGNPVLLKLIDVLDVQLEKMDAEESSSSGGVGGERKGDLHIDQS